MGRGLELWLFRRIIDRHLIIFMAIVARRKEKTDLWDAISDNLSYVNSPLKNRI